MAATPGDWRFAASPAPEAIYGEGAASAFRLHCDSAGRRVVLTRLDAGAAAALTVRTSFGVRQLPLSAGSAALPAADALLDDIVSSRGRFAVEADGLPGLILPTWPEPARVIEECRG
jgi:hypothetical protein